MADREHNRRPWRHLHGKVVMVTGASSGIGRELCLDLAKAGCMVIAAARWTDYLQSLCEEIERLHGPSSSSSASEYVGNAAAAVALDVTADGAAIDASVQRAWKVFGRIDALVNNAGIRGSVSSPLDLTEEEWNNVLKTNLTGYWLVSKSVCCRMRDSNIRGSVINVSSIAGLPRGQLPHSVGYSVSTTGVDAMTRVMALELGVYRIRVNSIAPGLFRSEITENLLHKNWLNRVAERIVPLQTFGTSDPAMTSLLRYLIHDLSEYVTGNIFVVKKKYFVSVRPVVTYEIADGINLATLFPQDSLQERDNVQLQVVDAGITLSGVPIFSSL